MFFTATDMTMSEWVLIFGKEMMTSAFRTKEQRFIDDNRFPSGTAIFSESVSMFNSMSRSRAISVNPAIS